MSDTRGPDESEVIENEDGDEPVRRGLTAAKGGIPQAAPAGGEPVPPDNGGMTPDKDVIGSG